MFLLKARDETVFYLLNGNDYTVGRKDCDLLITNDQSISRLHAKISWKNNKPVLVDAGSRYGTFVNRRKLLPNTEVELKANDDIRFGQLRSFYMVEEMTIITTTSSIKGDQKGILTNNIGFLGGSLVPNWNANCTYVTVEEILLTVKVLCAIIKGIPIVTLKYWEDFVANVKSNLPPPNVANYKPECSEVTLNKNISLKFKPERLHLFQNKVFVFPTRNDMAKMISMIKLAGGDAISWDTNPLTTKDLNNPKIEYVILQMNDFTTENIEPTLLEIINYNTTLGKRTIPLQEIALALIYCSCEKDCNPNFDRKGALLATKTQQLDMLHTGNILAMSTQTQESAAPQNLTSLCTIPETDEIEIEHIKEEDLKTMPIIQEVQQPTSVKRENEPCPETLFNTTKKIKLETLSTKSTIEKLGETMGNASGPSGKGDFTLRHDLMTSTKELQSKRENSNPFTKKRKVEETDEVDRSAKRTLTVETDNVSSSNASKVINPFSFLMSKRSSKTSQNAAVPSTSRSKQLLESQETPMSSTVINDDVSCSLRLDISAIVPVDSNMEKSYCWFSKIKSETSTSINGNSTVQNLENSVGEVDEDYVKYIESFRNTLVIKEESMVVRRNSNVSSTFNNVSSNGKNFKKFKKVQPLKIQTTIVPESSYEVITFNDHCAVQAAHEDSDNDDKLPLQSR